VEVDVRRLADGTLVACHDATTPDGEFLRDLTPDGLAHRGGGRYAIPLLAEVLTEMAGRCRCHLDLKEPGYEEQVAGLAASILGGDGFVVSSLEDESIRAIKRAFPRVPAGLSLGRKLTGYPPLAQLRIRLSELFPRRRVKAANADFVSVNHRLARVSVLRFCESHQLPAFVWTVNRERDLRRFLRDKRVRCLITDSPAEAMRLRSQLP
jgi:glycerophosphoryl diester phosphodiesterase